MYKIYFISINPGSTDRLNEWLELYRFNLQAWNGNEVVLIIF